jgi:hypothetical protein
MSGENDVNFQEIWRLIVLLNPHKLLCVYPPISLDKKSRRSLYQKASQPVKNMASEYSHLEV